MNDDFRVVQPGDLDPTDFLIDPDSGLIRVREGASAPSADATYIAAVTISGETAVMLIGGAEVEPVDPSVLFAYAGVTLTAAQTGNPVQVRRDGVMASDTWQWVPTLPIFIGAAGRLTQDVPMSGYAKLIGYALDAHTIFLAPEVTIKLGG